MEGSKIPADATQQLANPSDQAGNAKGEPDKPDNSADSQTSQDDEISKIRQELEMLTEQNKHLRSEVGRLGDELGEKRNQVKTAADIKDIAEKFQSTILNVDDPETAFRAMLGLIGEAFNEHEKMERDKLNTYKLVVKRNPDLSKISYNEFRNEALIDGVFNELNTGNAMERYMNNMLAAHNTPESIRAKIDEAKRQGAEEMRRKLELDGIIPKSGGGAPPPSSSNDEPPGMGDILFEQAYGKRPI